MRGLADKTAFVTGAASGIALGIANRARAGGRESCSVTSRKRRSPKPSKGSSKPTAAKATVERYGKVHVLGNNAGVGGAGPYGTWTDDDIAWTIGVNLMGVLWGIKIIGPLIESHGDGGAYRLHSVSRRARLAAQQYL
jgi:NAD(P)-dependent dehydrogenase (short-subunit alcohol dehydrogenase family)